MKRLLIILALALALLAFFYFDLGELLTLGSLKSRLGEIDAFYRANPLLVIGAFFAAYVAITAASVPGAAIMTLAAGAIFGVVTGTLVVSFASSLGATLAFLSSRYLFRDWVQPRFGGCLTTLTAEIDSDGAER